MAKSKVVTRGITIMEIFKKKTGAELFLEIMGFIALTLVFVVMCIDAAYATGRDNDDQQQDQTQTQDQAQDQTQTQTASADAGAMSVSTNNGNNQSINVNEAARPDDITIRNTASARPPNFNATAPCYYGWSAGVGVAGANIGGGKNKLDPECNLRETARAMAGLGEVELAIQILCATEAAQEALEGRCGITRDNVYVRVNEPVRYIERAHDDAKAAEHAVEVCSEATTRAFEHCQQEGGK